MEKIVKNSIITVVAVIIITLIFPSFIYADTSKIAFSSNRDGNHELYTMNADGSNQTRLTNNTAFDEVPSLSPDGTKIAFASNRTGIYKIYTMNADGTNVARLTNQPSVEYAPSFSPDGSKIAFYSC